MRRNRRVAAKLAKARKHARKTNVVHLKPNAASRALRGRALKGCGNSKTAKIAPSISADPGPSGFDWTEF
jgi:hypothetical protein